jgi:hypothetical protein
MRSALIAILFLLTMAPAASAASIAYIDGGEVWLSSLDGTQKARLSPQVVNTDGETEKWVAVAASDGGRIVAARNFPGRNSGFSWFKVWEPNGTSTVEGPLNAPSGWATQTYPLSFDVTADGNHMVYGYSNSGFCCPITFAQGTYVRPVTNSSLNPINVSGDHPTLVGSRMIAHAGQTVSVQGTSAPPYGDDFTPWISFGGALEVRRTDIAANGQLAAVELEQWDGGTQTVGKIAAVAVQGIDQEPTFPAAVDCFLPTTGVATEASLSLDATRTAWTDDGGLKVAGTPTGIEETCVLSSPPVVISATASQGAIGGANVGPFLPASGQPGGGPGTGGPGTGGPGTGGAGAPLATVPKKVTTTALASAKGVPIKVRVSRAGKVKVAGSVPAKVLTGSRSVMVAAGSATARRAGTVIVRLRLTAAGRKKRSRLKGARMTLRVTQGGLSSTKRLTLR